jgi:hypothetical protein
MVSLPARAPGQRGRKYSKHCSLPRHYSAGTGSLPKRAIANFAAAGLAGLARIVRRKPGKIRRRPRLMHVCLAKTGLTIQAR